MGSEVSSFERWRVLLLMAVATLSSLTVWFSTSAVAPALESEKGFSSSDIAWLTVGVQLGFVFGTFIIALTNLADLVNTRMLFAVCAVLAGLSNIALIFVPDGLVPTLVLRILTGMFLGGVYPPGMKIIAGWFIKGRGIAIGAMVGALTLGSGSSHLFNAVVVSNWEITLCVGFILSVMAGSIVRFWVKDGPFDMPALRFNPRYIIEALSYKPIRLILFGYLGHMWELYAMWASIPVFLIAVYGTRSWFGDTVNVASLVTFCVFCSGAAGCLLAGWLAERWGRCIVTSIAMILSGFMAIIVGFVPLDWTWLILVLVLIWGATVIADSAQFSTGLTELVEDSYRGTALAFQMGMGFLITIFPIKILPIISNSLGWGYAFAFLSIGPLLGIISMVTLRKLPESSSMAMGRK